MLVRITSPREDRDAREMYDRFVAQGACPFDLENVPLGLLRDARMDASSYILTVEVTNPVAVSYIRSLRPVSS